MPTSGTPPFTAEAKESVNKLIEGEMAFYQAWTKSWMDYLSGVEVRRNAAAKAVLESNAKMIQSGQEVIESAVKYGESFIDWSMETAKGMKG
jgi:predicted Ser/Thr protein kinase